MPKLSGDRIELHLLEKVTRRVKGHIVCALGDASAWPIEGLIRHFRPEIERRIHERNVNVSPIAVAAE